MAGYTLKLYARRGLNTSPGSLVGEFPFDAHDNAMAIAYAVAAFPIALANCDYALISGPFGRVVWEQGERHGGPVG